jgi:hypothetical protein
MPTCETTERFTVELEEHPGALPRRRWTWVVRDRDGEVADEHFYGKTKAERSADRLNRGLAAARQEEPTDAND